MILLCYKALPLLHIDFLEGRKRYHKENLAKETLIRQVFVIKF